VGCLAPGHSEGEPGDRTSNLPVTSQPALPPDLLPPVIILNNRDWFYSIMEQPFSQEDVLQGALSRPQGQQPRGAPQQKAPVTSSFLSILPCLAVEKGLTAQSFRCAGKGPYTGTHFNLLFIRTPIYTVSCVDGLF
jgi:hypothetical protein